MHRHMGEMSVSLSDGLTPKIPASPTVQDPVPRLRRPAPHPCAYTIGYHSPYSKKLTPHHTTRSSYYLDPINGSRGPAITWVWPGQEATTPTRWASSLHFRTGNQAPRSPNQDGSRAELGFKTIPVTPEPTS